MKTRLLIIITILGMALLLPMQLVYAPPAPDHKAAFDYAEHVIIGKILSVEILSEHDIKSSPGMIGIRGGIALYEIEVEEYLKNPLDTDIIKVPGFYTNKEYSRGIGNLLYQVDQRVFLYIQKDYPNTLVDYDLIIQNHESRVLDDPICGFEATYREGKCVIDKTGVHVDPSRCWEHACDSGVESPLKQQQKGVPIDNIGCKPGMFVAYKIDTHKLVCVTPYTLDKLIERKWTLPHTSISSSFPLPQTTTEFSEYCDENQFLLQGGYYAERDYPLELKEILNIQTDGYQGINVVLHNPRDTKSYAYVFVDCIDLDVSNFNECQDASSYINTKNWPILECKTFDGKQFFVNENEEMAKNSGIELYTMNYLGSHSLEFVGKTDRVDPEISFSITAPNGDEISTWSEFAPSEGEFRTSITTAGPLWTQQDGLYIFTAKQVDVPYYTVYLEFELKDGKIIR